jgi:hypothetical protein
MAASYTFHLRHQPRLLRWHSSSLPGSCLRPDSWGRRALGAPIRPVPLPSQSGLGNGCYDIRGKLTPSAESGFRLPLSGMLEHSSHGTGPREVLSCVWQLNCIGRNSGLRNVYVRGRRSSCGQPSRHEREASLMRWPRRRCERDDRHLIKSTTPPPEIDPIEELRMQRETTSWSERCQ